ncbi:MAG: DUF1573 domain-containing protein [Breznakibacter sp.]
MKKIAFVLSLVMSVALVGYAQHSKPNINFKTTTYDFGDVNEEKGKVTYTFEFTNNGGQPLVVHNVTASCGCTTPEWTKMPIAPGGKGTVKATFDPANRPGPFNKTITVSSNSAEPTAILRIIGKVVPKPLTTEDSYPRQMGDIRLKAGHIAFTRIAPGTTKSESLEIINTSNNPVKIDFENVPAHLSVKVVPEVVQPGKTASIVADFDASKKDDWGFVVDQIFLTVNGKKDYNNNRLSVSGTIEEDFSALTPDQIAKAAKAEYSEKSFDFGTIKEGEVAKHAFVVKNTGQSNLVLRKVKASCGCTAVQPDKTMLAPGESTNIAAVFDSKGRPGRQNKSITVITNDPAASTVLLQITGEVVAK